MSIRLYIAAFYGAAAMVASGFADAAPLRAYDENIGGQLEAELADGVVLAEVIHTDIDAQIRDNVAEVQLRQVFSGLGAGATDATYLLPLGAGVEVIAIEVAEGTRVERKSIAAQAGPSFAGPRMFSQDLNLVGRDRVEVTLIYRQPVPNNRDTRSIVLPIATLPGGDFAHEIWDIAGASYEFADLPEYLGGEMVEPSVLSPDRVNVRVSIEHDAFAGIYSDTHEIDVTAVEGARIVEFADAAPVINRTFVLNYVPTGTGTTLVAQADRSQ